MAAEAAPFELRGGIMRLPDLDPHQRTELLSAMLEYVAGGVVQVAADGSILLANAEAVRILGNDIDELSKRSVADFEANTFREDGSPCPVAEYPVAMALSTGQPQPPMTIGVRRPDGSVTWAIYRAIPTRDPQGTLTGAFVTFVDITERKRVEDDLRRRAADWRSLAANLPDFVTIFDREMCIRSMNRVLPEFAMDDVIGTHVSRWVDPDILEDWKNEFNLALETTTVRIFEGRGLGARGETVWYETTIVPVVEDGKPVERVLVVARDITARRSMVASIAEKERLASVGMLSASVAHEIMNPLTYVLANLDFALSDRCPPGARQTKSLLDAREGAARMQQIVWDLRSLARAGTKELFYVDVRAVIDTALRLSGPEIARNVTVESGVDVPGVLASESRLCQVFINLLINAAQAMLDRPEGERRITIRTYVIDDLVGVDVRDTGRGIESEHLSRIFEPFYTTKANGTGLGLSISKENIERMGGKLEVSSEVGRGTKFTVWLSTKREPPAR